MITINKEMILAFMKYLLSIILIIISFFFGFNKGIEKTNEKWIEQVKIINETNKRQNDILEYKKEEIKEEYNKAKAELEELKKKGEAINEDFKDKTKNDNCNISYNLSRLHNQIANPANSDTKSNKD